MPGEGGKGDVTMAGQKTVESMKAVSQVIVM